MEYSSSIVDRIKGITKGRAVKGTTMHPPLKMYQEVNFDYRLATVVPTAKTLTIGNFAFQRTI